LPVEAADESQRETIMTRIPINDENDAQQENGAADGAQPPPQQPAGGAGAGDASKLQAERDDLFERLARATADFKNSQRRMQQEFDQRLAYANQSLIKQLLPVIDNFERALAVDPSRASAESVLKGLQLVHDQWLDVLKKENVNEIVPRAGDAFDPARHEALMQQDAPQFAGKGPTVVQTLQKGYSLSDRVLRPAQVAVSRQQ
jgi:molecular chaperone GrpE